MHTVSRSHLGSFTGSDAADTQRKHGCVCGDVVLKAGASDRATIWSLQPQPKATRAYQLPRQDESVSH